MAAPAVWPAVRAWLTVQVVRGYNPTKTDFLFERRLNDHVRWASRGLQWGLHLPSPCAMKQTLICPRLCCLPL